jgi:hypothetical protein
VKLIAAKMQYFTNSYIIKLDNRHILNLDAEVKNTTLRKYIMSRAPKDSVIQRLFVSVDKSWKGNNFTLTTVKPYAAEAMRALNGMIPECLHHYGEDAAKLWFSNAGLLAYHQVKWDPTKKSTTSQQDHTTCDLVEEDLFQLGSLWKLKAPIMKAKAKRGQTQDNPYVLQNLLDSQNTDSDVRSFGSAYQRTHDSDSIQTDHEDNMDTDPNNNQTVVQIDPTIIITEKTTDDDVSMDASSAGFTTGTTRSLLHKERHTTYNLRKELHELLTREEKSSDDDSAKTTKSTTEKLAQAMKQIQLMEEAQTHRETKQAPMISPDPNRKAPAIEEQTGTEAVSANRARARPRPGGTGPRQRRSRAGSSHNGPWGEKLTYKTNEAFGYSFVNINGLSSVTHHKNATK